MEFIHQGLQYAIPFLVVLTILVFIHELGHYLVAKRCGVKIETFSIGFGPELFGWNDRSGTRWKFSAIPLGGYVKMYGDADASSQPDVDALAEMTPEQKDHAYALKSLGSRAAIVAAGPFANFVFTIVTLSLLFGFVGQRYTPADVGEVKPGTAAEKAGLQPGDLITAIDGKSIERFEEIQQIVQLRPGESLSFHVKRQGQEMDIPIVPDNVQETDRFGGTAMIGRIGIGHTGSEIRKEAPVQAVIEAFRETGALTEGTLTAIWQIVKGTRSADQVGGIFSIAKLSGDFAKTGIVDFIYFMALLSVNLGLINLFPIPVLDGGHLLFYAIEAVRGKPLGEVAFKYSFRFGLALVLTLAIFANWNDLVRLGLINLGHG